MDRAAKLLRSYLADDGAATAIEYGLIAGGISIAIAIVILQVGIGVQALFQDTANIL